MYKWKSKLVIGLLVLFSFGWAAQASTIAPLPVAAIKEPAERKAYQARIAVTPLGTGFQGAFLQTPAGKRFVIENVSVITRSPEGLRMEVNFFCYIDANDDGEINEQDITFHRIALTDQGTFNGTSIATANHRVLVFADSIIGEGQQGITIQARLNGTYTPGPQAIQAQFTFSGYLEDIPEAQ